MLSDIIVAGQIVEIGAVKLDSDYRQVGKYSAYVRPRNFPVGPSCTRITGIAPNRAAKCFSNAAPVGVQSSPWTLPPYIGTSRRI